MGVKKGRVCKREREDMSHLEPVGILPNPSKDQEEARRREEETRATRGETEKKWRRTRAVSHCVDSRPFISFSPGFSTYN